MRFCVHAVPGDGLMGWAFTHPLKDMAPSDPFQMFIPGTGEVFRDVGGLRRVESQLLAQYHICRKYSKLGLPCFHLKLFHQQSDYH